MNILAPEVDIRDTGTIKGRGGYARRRFASGETVESCPVVLFGGPLKHMPGEIKSVLFNWGVLSGSGDLHCLALGYGSLYNHDNPANMRYEADADLNVLRFIAVRQIEADEELTVNYNALGGGPVSRDEGWFAARGIEPLRASDTQTEG